MSGIKPSPNPIITQTPTSGTDTSKSGETPGYLSGIAKRLASIFGSPDKQLPTPSKHDGQVLPEGSQNGGRRCRRRRGKLHRRSTLRKTKQIRHSLRNK